MAVENENLPMVVDGEADEEDYTANVVVGALNEALDEGDFPTAAEMAALQNAVTPRNDIRFSQPSGSLTPPPAAPSRANSPSASNNGESVSFKPVASSSHAMGGLDEMADSRAAISAAVGKSPSSKDSLRASTKTSTL